MTIETAARLQEGINDPSPISRVISLDWHDEPVDGILQLGTFGPTYKFHLIEQRSLPGEAEVPVYALYPLQDDSLRRLVEVLSAHVAPNWPGLGSDLEVSVRRDSSRCREANE